LLDRVQLETIAKVMQTLNYYQILKITPLASEADIQDAYHREALQFHPDQYFGESNLQTQQFAKEIYAKVVEAYHILSDRKRRMDYDNKLKGIDRFNEEESDEDAVTSVKKRPEWASGSPGEKFFKLAEKAFQGGDLRTAMMNIQIALGTEPSNPRYMQLKEKVGTQLKK